MSRWQPNTVERLQEAAMTLFHERGYSDVTVADIAEHAGLTKRSFFNHFPDKREVLFAGSTALEEAVGRFILESDREQRPIDVAISALTLAGETLSLYSKVARLRQDVIASSPELHERSLIKMASLARVIATGLVSRDSTITDATLVADSAVTVFGAAYDRWADSPASEFSDLMQKVLAELRAGIGAASPDATVIRAQTKSPARGGALSVVRPEGFEPPAYCSVVDGQDGWLCSTCGATFTSMLDYEGHSCLQGGIDRLQRASLNPPCPVCGAPIVWGVCVGHHIDDLALAA